MNCEYCGEPADGTNEHNELVCAVCWIKFETLDLVDASSGYDPKTDELCIWISFHEGCARNGMSVQSAPLTISQAQIIINELQEAIVRANKLRESHRRGV